MEDEIAKLLVADMQRELDNKDPSTYVVTVRTGSAEGEFTKWRTQPRARRTLPSGATFVDPVQWAIELADGATDNLVLDEVVALSVNPSVMMPILAGVNRFTTGTITVLREGSYTASATSETQQHWHEMLLILDRLAANLQSYSR